MRQYSNGSTIIKTVVVATDYAILNILLLVFIHWAPSWTPDYIDYSTKTVFVVANFAMMIGELLFSTVVHRRFVRFHDVVGRVLGLSLVQVFCMALMLRLLCDDGGFFHFLVAFFFSLFGCIVFSRAVQMLWLRHYRRSGGNSTSIIFVGHDPSILLTYREMVSTPSRGYQVLGYYSNEYIENCPSSLKRLGSLEDLNREMKIINDTPIDTITGVKDLSKDCPLAVVHEIFVSISHDYTEEIVSIRRFCEKNVIRFYYVPRMFGNYRLHLKAEHFGDIVVFTNLVAPLDSPVNRMVKRTFDVVVSGLVCLCMLPFLPILALIIKCQSPGPLFFRQERTGLNGKPFMCLKFRSMHVNKDADKQQATKKDPRKFAFGNFMRKANIDEFPQFFNVLKGDMSIVGPRPHMLRHTEIYSQLINKYMVRHFSKPGITGWAQVTGYRGETKELWQMEERVRRDVWYIEHWSPWLDIKIILMTAASIFKHDKHAY